MWFSCNETYWWSRCTSSAFVIYWCWLIFVFKMFHNFNTAFVYLLMLIIFHVQNVLFIFNWCLCDFLVLKHIDEVDALHLHLSFSVVDIFLVWKMFQNFNIVFDYLLMLTIFHVQNVLIILNWCLCDFLVLKHIDEVDALYLHLSFTDVDIIFVCKMFQNFNIAFDYLLMLIIFHVQNVLIIFDWCLCDFLVLKHIDEVDALHLHLSFTDVDIFSCCGKCSRISILFWIIYWCWLFFMCKMFLSFLTDVYVIFLYWNILMKSCTSSSCCHLVLLTYFWCGKCSQNFNIVFDYLLMLTIFHVQNVLIIQGHWCWHMWFSCTETYRWSRCTLSPFVIYWCWLIFMFKMFHNLNTAFDWYFFHVQNVLKMLCDFLVQTIWIFLCQKCFCFWLFTDVDYFFIFLIMCKMFLSFVIIFLVMFMFLIIYWFSCTETYWWSRCTLSPFVMHFICFCLFTFVIYHFRWCLCWLIFLHFIFICVLLKMFSEFQYCFWLFTDVDYFSCAKCSYHSWLMSMWFSCTETYRGHLLMLTYFCVKNVSEFQYCFWLFTDVDYFFMCKMFLSFSSDVYGIFLYWNISMKWMHFIFICHLVLLTYFWCGKCSRISILVLIIYWCWLFFMCKVFLSLSTDVYVIFLYWNISRSFTDVDIFWCGKCCRIWILFLMQIVLIIFDWCLCDFLVLKHIDGVHFIFIWCTSSIFYVHLSFMGCTETYWWSILSSFVI